MGDQASAVCDHEWGEPFTLTDLWGESDPAVQCSRCHRIRAARPEEVPS